MSFGFGDALAAAELLWDVYSRCRDAPSKMRETCSIVDSIRNELEFLAPEIERTTNPRGEVPAFFNDLHSSIEGLTGDLQKLTELVTQWNEAPLKRPWMIARMSKVDTLREHLATYNHTLERKVNYLLLQQINRFKSQHEQTVSGLKAQIDDLKLSQGPRISGTSNYVAQSYADVVPVENLRPQDARKSSHRRHSSGRKHSSPGHSPTPSVNSQISDEVMVTKPEKGIKSILLVDKTNYARSTMCQAFLELARVRAANATGQWLFDKVGSAGFGVESDFTKDAFEAGILTEAPVNKDGVPLSQRALNTIERLLANTKPREYTDIISRLREVRRSGLTLNHFQYSDVIICFGGDTYRVLRQMRAWAEEKLSEQGLRCRGWISRFNVPYLSDNPDNAETERCFDIAQQRMTEFLWTKLNWVEPANMDIVSGPYRTVQILVDRSKADRLKRASQDLTRKSGCVLIKVERYSAVKEKGIVSVVGRKDTLEKAERLVADFEPS